MANIVRPRSTFSRGHKIVRPRSTFNRGNKVNVYNINEVETNPLYGHVAFIFYVLIGFVQISYPDNPTAFQIHPKTMLVSVASFLLYCLSCWIKLKFKFATRVDTLIELFGSLSIVSLVLMFLPKNWGLCGYIIIYTIWFICHLFVIFIGLRQQVRRKLPPLLPSTSLDLN